MWLCWWVYCVMCCMCVCLCWRKVWKVDVYCCCVEMIKGCWKVVFCVWVDDWLCYFVEIDVNILLWVLCVFCGDNFLIFMWFVLVCMRLIILVVVYDRLSMWLCLNGLWLLIFMMIYLLVDVFVILMYDDSGSVWCVVVNVFMLKCLLFVVWWLWKFCLYYDVWLVWWKLDIFLLLIGLVFVSDDFFVFLLLVVGIDVSVELKLRGCLLLFVFVVVVVLLIVFFWFMLLVVWLGGIV